MCLNASERTQMQFFASEHVRTCPQKSKRFETFANSYEQLPNFRKIFEIVRKHSNASECIRVHPNASEHVRAHPKTLKNIDAFAKTGKTIATSCKVSCAHGCRTRNVSIHCSWASKRDHALHHLKRYQHKKEKLWVLVLDMNTHTQACKNNFCKSRNFV